MAQYYTGISIKKELFDQAKQYLNRQRPAGTFSGLVEIALEDFLKANTPRHSIPAGNKYPKLTKQLLASGQYRLSAVLEDGMFIPVADSVSEGDIQATWQEWLQGQIVAA